MKGKEKSCKEGKGISKGDGIHVALKQEEGLL